MSTRISARKHRKRGIVDENSAPNNPANSKVYVKFGPGSTQEMPIDWAEKILTNWRNTHPAQFGKALAEVVTGTK
jgi:hypothetical protein